MRRRESAAPAAEIAEEVRGIISLRLFGPRMCRDMLARVRAARGWAVAPVGVREADGNYGATPALEQRAAGALAPGSRSRLGREFHARMEGVVKPLTNRLWQTRLTQHMSTHFVRYVPGGFYLPHSDTTPESNYRYFTVLCYLNEDFDGGHTCFPDIDYSVEPRAGKAIVFPSSYLHGAEPVTAGEKYVVVSWLTGPPPVRWL